MRGEQPLTPVGKIAVILGRAYDADDCEAFLDDVLDNWAYLDNELSINIREELMYLWENRTIYEFSQKGE